MAASRKGLESILSECKMQNILPLQARCQFFLEGQERQIFYILNPESFYAPEFLKIQMEHLKEFIKELAEKEEHQPYQLILLGYGYEKGLGVNKDIRKVIKCYTEAAESKLLGNAMLGRLYAERYDFSRAHIFIPEAAYQNNPLAQRMMGLFYILGHGVQQLPDEAVTWLTKAAAQDDPIAQSELGTLLEEKKGDANIAEAKDHLTAAARNGNIDALAKLAYLLRKKDPKPSQVFLDYAYGANNKFGFYYKGIIKTHSWGFPPPYYQGLSDLTRAYALGCAEAYYAYYELMYENNLTRECQEINRLTGTFHYSISFDAAQGYLNDVPLEQFSPFMDENEFKRAYEERNKTKFACIFALDRSLKKAGKEMFDTNLVKLVTEFISTPEKPVHNSVLAEFKTANDKPLVSRAREFLDRKPVAAFYLFTDKVYKDNRLEQEKKLLGKLIDDLTKSKHPLTAEQQILLGFGYEKGIGVIKDSKNTVDCYRAASKTNPLGHTLLANYYKSHHPNLPDDFINHYENAAEHGEPIAMYQLASYHLFGGGQNPAEGLALLYRSAEMGYPPAQVDFALRLMEQPFTKKETLMFEAKSMMETAAKAGWPGALFQLGMFHMTPHTRWRFGSEIFNLFNSALPNPPNWENRVYPTPRKVLDYLAAANNYLDYSLQQERILTDVYNYFYNNIHMLALTHASGNFDPDLAKLNVPAFFNCILHLRHVIERCEPIFKERLIDKLKRIHLPYETNLIHSADKSYKPVIDYHVAIVTDNHDLLLKVAQKHPDRFRECLSYEFGFDDREKICSRLPPDDQKHFITQRRTLSQPVDVEAAIETKLTAHVEHVNVSVARTPQLPHSSSQSPLESKRKHREKKPTAGDIAHAQITAQHVAETKDRFSRRKNRLIQFVEKLQEHIGDQLTSADLSQSIYARGSGTLFQNIKEPMLNQILSELKNENPDFDQIKIRLADIINEYKLKLTREEVPDATSKLNNLLEFLFKDQLSPRLFEQAKTLPIKPEQIDFFAGTKNIVSPVHPHKAGKS